MTDAKWLPIDLCPSDTPVLLYSPWRHAINPECIEVRVYHDSLAGSTHAWATHWMPLPPPPENDK